MDKHLADLAVARNLAGKTRATSIGTVLRATCTTDSTGMM